MILLIEPNASIRKRLCDLLSRERILGVGTYNGSLEMLPATETPPEEKKNTKQNYETMYRVLKEKYDLLVKYVLDLARSTKNTK